jgi:predicted enzyme related to lactoylglutathione lyase
MFGAGKPGPMMVYFRVTDVDAAAARVRAAGGTAGETTPNANGWHADCLDDQGLAFSISST